MNIAAVASMLQQFSVKSQVSIAVAKLGQDAQVEAGNNMVRLMENSVTPHLGGNIDIKL